MNKINCLGIELIEKEKAVKCLADQLVKLICI